MVNPGPRGPRVSRRALGEVVHVDVVAGLGKPVGVVDDSAGEGVIANHLVQGVSVLEGVVRVQPVGVLVDDRLSSNLQTDVRAAND